MKLFGCTFVKNEEEMIPYVMPYIERLGYDKFVVYDDSSTDNTVEMLSKYPFVEIRYSTGTHDDFDWRKCNVQISFYEECWDYIHENNNEDVWMTFTDFDEVLYHQKQLSFRDCLKWALIHKYNYFDGQIIQLVPPKNFEEVSMKNMVEGGKLVHMIDGMRANLWSMNECFKPTLMHVNSFERVFCTCGNHVMKAALVEGRIGRNLSEQHFLTCFHLKYIDRDVVRKKVLHLKDGGIMEHFDDTYYNSMIGASFPLELYFAYNCLTYPKLPEIGMCIYPAGTQF